MPLNGLLADRDQFVAVAWWSDPAENDAAMSLRESLSHFVVPYSHSLISRLH